MKELLINKKWMGALLVLIYALAVSIYFTKMAGIMINQFMPSIVQETADFLPVSIQKGEIVYPKNTVIQKTYGPEQGGYHVVMDTRVDEFDPANLNAQGVYISKKYIYVVQKDKTEMRRISDIPDGEINQQMLNNGAQYISENSGKIIFLIAFPIILLFTMLMISLYTLITHWLMSILFHVPLVQTLRINTLGYVAIAVIDYLTPINFGFILTAAALLALNIAYNSSANTNQVKEAA